MRSAGFTFGAREGGHSAAVLEEGIDHLEDGARLGGGELFDLLEALQEARGAWPHRLGEGGEA